MARPEHGEGKIAVDARQTLNWSCALASTDCSALVSPIVWPPPYALEYNFLGRLANGWAKSG